MKFNILVLALLVFSCKKNITEDQCKENIIYFENARFALKEKDKLLGSVIVPSKNGNIVLNDSIIKKLVKRDTSFNRVMALLDKGLIAEGKSIYYSKNGEILFVLPQKDAFVVFDPFNVYGNTCGISDKVKHFLVKDWFFLYACED